MTIPSYSSIKGSFWYLSERLEAEKLSCLRKPLLQWLYCNKRKRKIFFFFQFPQLYIKWSFYLLIQIGMNNDKRGYRVNKYRECGYWSRARAEARFFTQSSLLRRKYFYYVCIFFFIDFKYNNRICYIHVSRYFSLFSWNFISGSNLARVETKAGNQIDMRGPDHVIAGRPRPACNVTPGLGRIGMRYLRQILTLPDAI